MTKGLRIRRGSEVIFDSSLAAGGVCLGIFTVPEGGGVFDFPAFAQATGIALTTGSARAAPLVTISNQEGHLQFSFPASSEGARVVLFAK